MSRNLPPGTTSADIDRGPSHEHEWRPVEGTSPVLEDMAAIFHEECAWAEVVNTYTDRQRDEVYYEYGAECDAERHYRFELAYVSELTDEGRPNLRVGREELDRLEQEGNELFEQVIDVTTAAEQAFPEETEVVEIDPDRQQGQVVIRRNGFELGYGPGVDGGEA